MNHTVGVALNTLERIARITGAEVFLQVVIQNDGKVRYGIRFRLGVYQWAQTLDKHFLMAMRDEESFIRALIAEWEVTLKDLIRRDVAPIEEGGKG